LTRYSPSKPLATQPSPPYTALVNDPNGFVGPVWYGRDVFTANPPNRKHRQLTPLVGDVIDPMKTKALAALTSADKPREY